MTYCFGIDIRLLFLVSIARTTGMNMSVKKRKKARNHELVSNLRTIYFIIFFIFILFTFLFFLFLFTDEEQKTNVDSETVCHRLLIKGLIVLMRFCTLSIAYH